MADDEERDDKEAQARLQDVIEALDGLSNEDQRRVLDTASIFYGLD